MCGDINVAEDAAQECFLQAWQHLDKYKPKGEFRHWLYKIAINKTYNILRTEKFTLDVDNYTVVDKNPGPEQKHEENVQAHFVQQAVISLPEASRCVLILREYEDMSYRDIADTLDIPIGTVMSRLNYARQILRRLLVGLLEVA
jgi:RNA polymerase sigma-70 factor (ECF subfamily)